MIFVERRRAGFTADLFWRVGLVWLAVSAIFVAVRWSAIAGLQLPDADDSLRLAQLRDLIAGQAWFDLHQYRVAPPEGMLMHWSRLVDVPLVIVWSALSPLLGASLAEKATLVIVPLFTLFAAMLLAGRLAWRMLGDGAIVYTCVVLVLMTAVTGQIQPLRIDHHGWQIVAVLAALNGLAARNERTGGRIAGLAMALGMAISLELLPVAALIGAVLALRWLLDPKARLLCLHYIRTLAVTSLLAFLATRGAADLTPHCDILSPAYLAGLLAVALGFSLLGLSPAMPRPALAAGMLASASVGVGALLVLAPQCTAGPFATLDPLVQKYWYANVREGMPVWRQEFDVALRLIIPPLAGLFAAIRLWQGCAGWLRRFWFEYALIMAGTLALGLVVSRSSGFAAAVASIPLGWMLRDWHRKAGVARSGAGRIGLLLAAVLVVMPDLPLKAARLLDPAKPAAMTSAQRACDIAAAGPTLKALPPATILAPIDNGPMLLLHSPHKVLATAHHRAPAALRDVIAVFTSSPEIAEPIVRARGAAYLAVCPALAEIAIYREAAPGGLAAALANGKTPAWLRPVPMPQDSGLLVWEVIGR
jgi:hypothetical protein